MSASWADIYHGLKRHVNGKPLDVMSGTIQYGHTSPHPKLPLQRKALIYFLWIKFQRQGFNQGLPRVEAEAKEVWE